MIDKCLAVFTLAVLIGFCGIIVWFVPEFDLIVVAVLVIAMAVYDFYRTAFRRNNLSR